MQIAFLLTQSLESPSGLGRFGPLARALAQEGHQVEVFALHPQWENLSEKVLSEPGLKIHYVSQMHVQKEGARKIHFSSRRLLWVSLTATLRLTQALWRSHAEIIQVCKPQPMNTLAARLARRGRKIYYDCDDYEVEINRFSAAWQRWIVKYFEDSIVKDAAGITVNTRFLADRTKTLGYPEDRILFVPNGVERHRFGGPPKPETIRQRWGIPPDAPLIEYCGALAMHSHPVNLLLEAFQVISRELPQARLLLVGGGEDFDALVKMSEELGIMDKTTFAGVQPSPEIPNYLAAADVTVDPVYDNLVARARCPLKIVESLAAGTPVVTSDVGDRRELLNDGRCGILIPPGNPQELANGLLSILQNPEMIRRMKLDILLSREAYFWDRLVHRFSQVYDR